MNKNIERERDREKHNDTAKVCMEDLVHEPISFCLLDKVLQI